MTIVGLQLNFIKLSEEFDDKEDVVWYRIGDYSIASWSTFGYNTNPLDADIINVGIEGILSYLTIPNLLDKIIQQEKMKDKSDRYPFIQIPVILNVQWEFSQSWEDGWVEWDCNIDFISYLDMEMYVKIN